MKNMVETIVRGIVDNPDDVKVEEIDADGTVVYELRVAEGDLGKVIGKQGRTAKAIRSLLGAAAAKENKRAALEILE